MSPERGAIDSQMLDIRWMEEILHHLGWLKPYNIPITNGINHRFQLVQDFFHPPYFRIYWVYHTLMLKDHSHYQPSTQKWINYQLSTINPFFWEP